MPTRTLPEYGHLQDVALDDADIRALAPFCPRQLTLTPAFGRAGYDLSANSWVGAITTPNVSLILEPKVPISRLLFMLSYTLDPKRWRDAPFDYEAQTSLVEAIVPGFVHQVRRAIRPGLLQGYRNQADTLTTVRGRIDFAQQLRRHHGRTPPVEVLFDEFTDDIIENQVLKAAIHRLGHLHLRSPTSRGALRTLGSAFSRVTPHNFDRRQLPEVTYTRLNRHYRPAVELARLILQATSFDLRHGGVRSSAFLVDMNTVFEAFVTVALREALQADERTFPNPGHAPPLRLDDDHLIRLKPDLTWLRGRKRVFVGDVKYKKLGLPGYLHSDLYQLLAYAVATDLPDALLIYAAGEANNHVHTVSSVGRHLHVRTLDISAEPDQILDHVGSLAEEIRELAQMIRPPQSLHVA